MAEVANKKLFENDRVIVWEMVVEPGESTGLHTHRHEYFFHVLEGSTMHVTDKEGALINDVELETGSTNWVTLDGDDTVIGEVRVPATHDAKNIGSSRFREILVELK